MNHEARTPRTPAGGFFRVGAVSPKRTRRSGTKPSVEKRKVDFKKGIDTRENRKRRSRFSQGVGRDKKKRVITHLRSGAKENEQKLLNLDLGGEAKTAAKQAGKGESVFAKPANPHYYFNPSVAVFGISASSAAPLATPSNTVFGTKVCGEKKYNGSTKEKLVAFYNDHNRSKLAQVDDTLAKYTENEDKLFLSLANKYNVSPAVFGVRTHEKKYTGSATDKLAAFYVDHNPSKLPNVEKTLAKYAGKEDELFLKLARQYEVDPAVFGICDSSASTSNRAFAWYASGKSTFGYLASPKAQLGGFGSFRQSNHKGKGRSTITSLKTYTDEPRASSDGESIMECD